MWKYGTGYLELFILSFVDNVVLISEIVVRLQNQLNNIHIAFFSLDLKVNLEKNNIAVFHEGGVLGAKKSWSY